MMASGKSTYSDKMFHYNNQGAFKHASTKYYETFNSSLDPIETPLALSALLI